MPQSADPSAPEAAVPRSRDGCPGEPPMRRAVDMVEDAGFVPIEAVIADEAIGDA